MGEQSESISLTLCDPMDCSPPGPSVPGILQEQYWGEYSWPSPGDLPNPRIKPGSPALQADPLPFEDGSVQSVQSLSCVRLFATPWIAARQASLSITNSWSSLRLMSIESVIPSSHLILCHPLLLLPPIPPSIKVFSNESALCMRWPKYWFQLQHHSLQRNPRVDLLQNGLVGSPCSPRDSQESSPTPQFKSNSSALSLLHSPTLTSIRDYWKNHSFD